MVPCSGGNIVGILPLYVRMRVGSLEEAGFVEEKSGNGYSGGGGGWLVGTDVMMHNFTSIQRRYDSGFECVQSPH